MKVWIVGDVLLDDFQIEEPWFLWFSFECWSAEHVKIPNYLSYFVDLQTHNSLELPTRILPTMTQSSFFQWWIFFEKVICCVLDQSFFRPIHGKYCSATAPLVFFHWKFDWVSLIQLLCNQCARFLTKINYRQIRPGSFEHAGSASTVQKLLRTKQ